MRRLIEIAFFSFFMWTTSNSGICAEPPGHGASSFQEQLVALKATTEQSLVDLALQSEAATEEQRNMIAQQVSEVKRQSEIGRLEILREWAVADGDSAKLRDVDTALQYWLNPQQPETRPLIERKRPMQTGGVQMDTGN